MDRKKTKDSIYLIYEFLSEQGGLEREIINHANFLIEEGFDVKVLTCYYDEKIRDLLPFDGIQIESISKIKSRFEWLDLVLCFLGFNNLNKYNPKLFLSYSAPSNFLIRNKNTKKINYINHFPHYLYLDWKKKVEWARGTQGIKRWMVIILSLVAGKFLKKVDKNLVRENDLIFMNSKFTKERLSKIYNVKSVVSYPPVDSKFKPSKEEIDRKYIFSSSRIIPDKKYEWLIESVSHMRNKIPLLIAGSVEENYKKKLTNLAKGKGIRLEFLGRLNTDDIIKYYTNASVFAFPTPGEDFGLVPVESLACGTPVVVWGDGAGPTEQIINGLNGYYAKPYDKKDFANKLDQVLDNDLKIKNRQKIISSSKKFSAKEIKKDFTKEVMKVLSRGS